MDWILTLLYLQGDAGSEHEGGKGLKKDDCGASLGLRKELYFEGDIAYLNRHFL